MKAVVIICSSFYFFTSTPLKGQDILVLKAGSEIRVKVTEISSTEVKYKKWENQDGPVYTESKKDVLMIRYQNGTKDVFDTQPTTMFHFEGTWKNSAGGTLEIKRINDNEYDVSKYDLKRLMGTTYNVGERIGQASLKNGNLEIGGLETLKFTPDEKGNLYHGGNTYFKVNNATNTESNSNANTSNYSNTSYYNSKYSAGSFTSFKSSIFYKSNALAISNATFAGLTTNSSFESLMIQSGQILKPYLYIEGLKPFLGRYSFTYSICITLEDGQVFEKKENMTSSLASSPIILTFPYQVPTLQGTTQSKQLFVNFVVSDNNSNGIMQGYFPLKLVR